MGGRLALHLALDTPSWSLGWCSIGATAGIADDAERAARRAADERLADHLEVVGVTQFVDEWLAQPLFAGLAATPPAVPERLVNTPAGLASSLRLAGTGTQEPLWDRLGALDMPVLVMAGVDDAKFSAIADRLAALDRPERHRRPRPRAGHTAPLENPADTASIIRRWLRAHPA